MEKTINKLIGAIEELESLKKIALIEIAESLKEEIQNLQNLIDFYRFSNKQLRQTVINQNEKIKELQTNKNK